MERERKKEDEAKTVSHTPTLKISQGKIPELPLKRNRKACFEPLPIKDVELRLPH